MWHESERRRVRWPKKGGGGWWREAVGEGVALWAKGRRYLEFCASFALSRGHISFHLSTPPSFLFIFFTIGPDFDSRCNHARYARTDGTVLYFAVMKKTVDSTVLDDAGFEQIYYHYARLLLDLRYATGREYFVRCIKRSRDESPFAQCPQKAAVNGIVTRLQGPCRDPTIVPPKSREMMCTPFRHPRHGNGVELVARLEIWLIGQGRDSLGIDARHE
jgi:hypothetical protein